MIRALPIVLALGLVLVVASTAHRRVRARASGAVARRGATAPGGYAFDRRGDQVRRRLKGIDGPVEHREEIAAFLETHRGVEAYVEPETVMSPRSVVLVDADGEWRRFELREDALLRRLAAERGIRIFDAALTGYPHRMRRRRPGEPVHG